MSSLKDIMDVDVEPLESQARRSREAAQQQRQSIQSQPHNAQLLKNDNRDSQPVTRRRSNRVFKPSSQGASRRPSLGRRRSSGTAESMDYDSQMAPGSSQQPDISRQLSRGSNPPDSVRYTPVTGRVSRAKKGQPVHICDQCDPPRVFTRAEHLRRHQLGHQKPAYSCTFEDCEKAFHRPDLLARHLNRHENQGEKAYKAGDARRGSSSESNGSPSPTFKVETPLTADKLSATRNSPTPNPAAARIIAGAASGAPATSLEATVSNFRAVNFSGPSNEQTTARFDRGGHRNASTGPTDSNSVASPCLGHATSFPATSYIDIRNQSIAPIYPSQDPSGEIFPASSAATTLPLLTLQVPDQCQPPALSYANSPWCSSDSTFSTPSDASHRYTTAWGRDRSASVVTNPEWNNQSIAWSPQYGNASLASRTSGLGTVPENFESPPYISPHMSPPNASYTLDGVSSPAATAARFSKSELAGIKRRTATPLVGTADIDATSGEVAPVGWSNRTEEYLISYRAHLEPVYAIEHNETFQSQPNGLVKNAMAALGSQYHNEPEDRQNGGKLHDACKRIITLARPDPDLQTMQAIYLTEVFARFCSQKTDVRPSVEFRKLYKMLVDSSTKDSKSIFKRLTVKNVNTVIDKEMDNCTKTGSIITRQQVIERIWRKWIEWEVRQRLRAACFMFDQHQSMCYEQRRVQPRLTAENTFLILPCPNTLWHATTSEEWYNNIHLVDCSAIRLTHPEDMSLDEIKSLPFSSKVNAGAAALVLLPPRDQAPLLSLNPSRNAELIKAITYRFSHFIPVHGYLALYHTPLRQLLSLTGNTWLFGQKMTSHSDINAIIPAIRNWSSSPAAAHAAWHACSLLKPHLQTEEDINKPFRDVSEYWFIYTCTLIIWAFGHRMPVLTVSDTHIGSISRQGSSDTLNSSENPHELFAAALAWTEAMLEHKADNLFHAGIRVDTASAIDAVRLKLKKEAALCHGRSDMLLDACRVLDRIQEGGKWF